MSVNKTLGRGLNALLGKDVGNETVSSGNIKEVALSDLEPSSFQPRRYFDEEAINDLVESVASRGVIQPLIVREKINEEGKYEIIGGERRYRAAKRAGLVRVPVIVKIFSDKEALEVALIENLQRQDLNPLEEAEGYRRLMDEFQNTQEDLAHSVGKSRSHIANSIRLLALPDAVKERIESGALTAGHARTLVTAKNPEELADIIISKGLNVRQAERLVQNIRDKKEKPAKKTKNRQDECDDLAEKLSRSLGVNVGIKIRSRGGSLILNYDTLEQLDMLIRRLCGVPAQTRQTEDFSDEDEQIVFEEGFDASFEDESSDNIEGL